MRPSGADPKFGILLKIASVLGFTGMGACIKATADVVPTTQACFFRSFFALLTIVVFLAWRSEFPAALRTRNPWGHVWRSVIGLTAMLLNFAALGLLPLPDAIALGYAMPLFVTIFAALLLGEAVRTVRLSAVFIGLFGVLIILWPRLAFLKGEAVASTDLLGAASALGGAAAVALAAVVVARLVVGERTSTVVFYFSALSSVGLLITAPFGWRMPDGFALMLLILSGVFGGLSQLLLTECYRYADASAIAPFEYVSMLFGIFIGYTFFGEVPTWTVLAGGAVVIGAGLLVVWGEQTPRPRPDKTRGA
ncbi:MAG: DMT family transporter [Hyphomicrobiaceae bacterium]